MRNVNKFNYVLLALLFGGIGLHKFYSGRVFWGLVFLLLAPTGISAVFGVLEAIIALCKPTACDGTIRI